MNDDTLSAAAIRNLTPAEAWEAFVGEISDSIATAIKAATGATVEATHRTADGWTISGADADVQAARPVMRAAGMALESSHFDITPDSYGDVDTDRYDYWIKA